MTILHPGNLQIQCNPYQNTNGIFHRTKTNISKIHVEIQKTQNSQTILGGVGGQWMKLEVSHFLILNSTTELL